MHYRKIQLGLSINAILAANLFVMNVVLVGAILLQSAQAQERPVPPLAMPPLAGGTVPAAPTVKEPVVNVTLPKGVLAEDSKPLPVAPPADLSASLPPLTPVVGGDWAVVAAAVSKQYSYGNSDLSILFLPSQINNMKTAITYYEDVNAHIPAVVAPTVVDVPKMIEEPGLYPVFFLSSIVYHGPADWSVWICCAPLDSNQMPSRKITPKKNNTDVKIVSVSPDRVTFAWKPDFVEALTRRRLGSLFESTDGVKNKLADSQLVSQDDATGLVTFTLRQNQSFAVSYFSIFEGYMDSARLAPMLVGDGSLATSAVQLPALPQGAPNGPPPSPVDAMSYVEQKTLSQRLVGGVMSQLPLAMPPVAVPPPPLAGPKRSPVKPTAPTAAP